ncbi:MAG: amino acid adenylation domain-containing protein, partial [bacterium]|nr:amino acid adenylation domain-containing protein [bacterium]
MKKKTKENIADILALTPMQQGMLFHYFKEPTSALYFEQLTLELFTLELFTLELSTLELSTLELSTLELSTLELSGRVEKKLFEKAWNTVIQTNEMLRTVFRWEKIKNPVQVILKQHQIKPRYYNFPIKPEAADTAAQTEQKVTLEEVKTKDREEGFDLREVPFRITLYKHEKHRYTMIISHHHILYDGWSTGIILKEFFDAYDMLTKGKTPKPITKTQYKEFIEWHRKRDKNKEKEYWKNYLKGIEPQKELSIKRKKNRTEVTITATSETRIEDALTKKIQQYAEKHKLTPASLLYAAWGLLIQRYNNTEDVLFGTTVSGRNAGVKGIEEMAGLFINTIPLRVKTGTPSGVTGSTPPGVTGPNYEKVKLVQQIDEALRQRQEYEGTSLVNIKEYSDIDGNEDLFDIIVVIENYPLDKQLAQKESALSVESYTMTEMTNYDLTVGITVFEGMELSISYDKKLFEKESIVRLTHHFKNILQDIINNPLQLVSTVKMMSDEEIRQVIYKFNATGADYPRDKTIHELFEEQEEKTPHSIAAAGMGTCPVYESGTSSQHYLQLTYRELNERANHLANHLHEKGFTPGAISGMAVSATVETVIAILAIWKAGGSYLPIDLTLPVERIKYMLADANAKHLLYKTHDPHGMEQETPLHELREEIETLSIDKMSPAAWHRVSSGGRGERGKRFPPGTPKALPTVTSSLNNAYIIYTSGTTGKPKGVMVPHSSFVNRLYWLQSKYAFDKNDVIIQKTPITFDVSVCELFRWIPGGGRLVIMQSGGEKEPGAMVEAIVKNRATTIDFIPSMLNIFLDYVENNDLLCLSSLRWVFIGVEAIGPKLLRRFDRLLNKTFGTRLINAYGPTEATVDITYFDCSDDFSREIVPIGHPIQNTQIYILDKNGRIQPLGVPGELCIAGESLAWGYLNKPELTAERFAKASWQLAVGWQKEKEQKANEPEKGHQLQQEQTTTHNKSYWESGTIFSKRFLAPGGPPEAYKTGDRARWLPDGNIEFLGRIDHQVKIRGMRVELGEIERCLLTHPEIKETVVLPRELKEGDNFLCAYVVMDQKKQAIEMAGSDTRLEATLTKHLSQFLPGYMIPSYFITLEKLPLTPNEKIDRKALSEFQISNFKFQTYIAPRNEHEKKLAAIWADALSIEPEKIGINDDFFSLGGHSLKVITVTSMIYKTMDVEVTVNQLFQNPTIKTLARCISEKEKNIYLEIKAVEEREYYDLSYAQRRLWIICQFENESITYNMVDGFIITGVFNMEAFNRAVQTLVTRHQSLRTVFIDIEGTAKQRIIKKLNYKPEYIDLRKLGEEEKKNKTRQICTADANFCFDLEKAPLFLFKLLRLEDKKYYLLINFHHIINDGWSSIVMKNEMSHLYNAYNLGDQPSLPPLELQYKDYTAWHNAAQAGTLPGVTGYMDGNENYWLNKFKDRPNGIELPIDFPRPPIQTFNGGRVFFEIDKKQTDALNRLAYEEDITLFMKMLTMLSILLSKYSGEEDIIIASPTVGRKRSELQSIVGFLVNTLVYRLNVKGDEGFEELSARVKEETLACYENQDYPFDVLVERLGIERDLSRSPLFNVMLAFNNTEIANTQFHMEGVQCTPYLEKKLFDPGVFDLLVNMDDMGDRIACQVLYNSDIFRQDTVERFAANFLTLTENLTAAPETEIAQLRYIHEQEYEQILETFNRSEAEFPTITLRELFENQADWNPGKIAVVYKNQAITYDKLNREANRIAQNLLREYSLIPGEIIGLCMERSPEMIIAILGIIKTGAAYLSLDPTYPTDRVLHMLTDSRCRIVLADTYRPRYFENYKGRHIDIKKEWSRLTPQSTENPGITNKPDDTMYVIYTSGTTGVPNGAVLTHGILTNLVQWQQTQTTINSSLRCLQFTSTSFCVSFQEIMATLTSAGELHLIGDIERQDIDYLMTTLARHKIEILYLPFSYLNFLFSQSTLWGTNFKHSLKHIITAGEQLKITAALRKFLEVNPHLQLHNHYGSSEMHVVASYTLDAANVDKEPVPPAGKPIANTRIFILDEKENPVPIGVWGELYVSGSTEVAGYINNERLSNQKLNEHPILPYGKRLYRSGDIGRQLPDGNICLKGRKDSQVKIRGFRVELSEIESKIVAINGVKDCVV